MVACCHVCRSELVDQLRNPSAQQRTLVDDSHLYCPAHVTWRHLRVHTDGLYKQVVEKIVLRMIINLLTVALNDGIKVLGKNAPPSSACTVVVVGLKNLVKQWNIQVGKG